MKNLLLPALFVSCTIDENENVIKTNPGTNAGITTSSVYNKVYPEASNRNNPYDAAGKLFILECRVSCS